MVSAVSWLVAELGLDDDSSADVPWHAESVSSEAMAGLRPTRASMGSGYQGRWSGKGLRTVNTEIA
jgi:hypothetical protein